MITVLFRRSRAALVALTLAALLLVAAGPSPAAARREARPLSPAGLLEPAGTFRTTVVSGPRRHAVAHDFTTVIVTKDGYPVHIIISSSYAPDPAIAQTYVDFVDTLLHGDELGRLTIDVETAIEVQKDCGIEADACYYDDDETLIVPGQNEGGTPVEQLVAHEYGHHVLRNRSNPPWNASDWGSKRWASYLNICRLTRAHKIFPGDEGAHYELNPAEGFAESFRVVNAARATTPWPALDWNIVSRFFYPDDTAAALLVQDVLQPWTGPNELLGRGALRPHSQHASTIRTVDDGVLTAKVKGLRGATVAVYSADGRRLSQPGASTSFTVCGQRSVVLVVSSPAKGAYSLSIARP